MAQIYNANNINRIGVYQPKIKLTDKRSCCLNSELARITKLKSGDKISFCKKDEDWYFFKSNDGFELWKNSDNDNSLYFSCANLVRLIQEQLDIFDTLLMRVSSESIIIDNTKHYLILTASVKKPEINESSN